MRNILMIAMVAGLMAVGLNAGYAQPSSGLLNYRDLSKKDNQRTQREERKKREAEEAKRKAEEEKRRQERTQRWQQEQARRNPQRTPATNAKDSKTSSGKSAISRGVGNKSVPDGSSDPTMREITEVMLDAVKTRKVDFDPEEARDQPNLILLNSPVFDATTRVRAGDASIAQPL